MDKQGRSLITSSYLQENFGLSLLVVSILKDSSTDPVGSGLAFLRDRRFDTRNENPVSINKLGKRVTNRVTCTADPDRFHHSGIAELTYAQCAVKQLQQTN